MTYFDHNATHPLLPVARDAWLSAIERFPGNPSSPHRLGDRADRALSTAREQLAEILGCDAHEIVWTSGATESNNTAIAHLAATRDGEALVSSIEHPCALAATRKHFSGRHREIPVNAEGYVDLEWLETNGDPTKTACVIILAANNETGVWQPWSVVKQWCADRGIPFLCDATQWIGRAASHGLGTIDFISGCAHKFGGPAGVGFLKCPADLTPLLVGGRQEGGRRAGTENVAGVLAMLAALSECEARRAAPDAENSRLAWRTKFEEGLVAALPGTRIVGAETARLWNTVSAIVPEARDCRQRWVVKMDKLGFAVSTGSACASGKEETSHVLRAMGYSSAEAGRALRFSSGWHTTPDDWAALLVALKLAGEELL